jgi:hypothetical protein
MPISESLRALRKSERHPGNAGLDLSNLAAVSEFTAARGEHRCRAAVTQLVLQKDQKSCDVGHVIYTADRLASPRRSI